MRQESCEIHEPDDGDVGVVFFRGQVSREKTLFHSLGWKTKQQSFLPKLERTLFTEWRCSSRENGAMQWRSFGSLASLEKSFGAIFACAQK